ncbi:MAG: hypothetical protein HYT27_00440 [Parcubacteria group bacterium]|nr:hypothetical protein [Parcubacteria group bacterium]
MDIRIIKEPITHATAKEIAAEFYKDMVKGVVDIERKIIALGGEYHIDANMKLIADGSIQSDVWGFNFYSDENRIEYVSLINIRPQQNNRTIKIQDDELKKKMENIIRSLIQ